MEEMMGIGDSDDTKTIDIKQEPCCETCNFPKISTKPEAIGYTSNKTDYLRHQDDANDETNIKTDNIMQPDNQYQNTMNEMKIKHEIDSDSDIEVKLAYRIIDTFNVCQVKTFKLEDKKILPALPLEVEMNSNMNICDNEKTALKKENMNYDNLNLEDDVHQLHSTGM